MSGDGMSDAQKTIAEFAARLAAKGAAQDAAAAQKRGEEKVVIRPAGAAPTGVRVSASSQPSVDAARQAVARSTNPSLPAPRNAVRSTGKSGKAKGGKPRKAATAPRRPMAEVLRGWTRDFRFRLLPVTIFVAVLMLGVRVGDMWRIATRDAQLPEFPVTLAQGPQTPPPANGAKPPADKAMADKAPAKATTNPAKDGPPPMANSEASTPAANAPLGPISDQELLQHFAERRAEIEKRTKEIEQREALLTAAEKRIDQKVSEMEKVRSDIQKLMSQGDEKQSAQLESLVKIYETMKPKEAARIFEELEMPVLLGVIQKMKESKAAPILASMDPVKAKEVTSALIERRVPMTAK
jgi:flagellar motility protein MotE (MotC chaperone)